jgi:hypothetical protein
MITSHIQKVDESIRNEVKTELPGQIDKGIRITDMRISEKIFWEEDDDVIDMGNKFVF